MSGPDHLLGLAPHAVGRRSGAWRVGLAWGTGHAIGTVVVSAAILVAAAAVHVEGVERWSERAAGLALVAMGVLGLLAVRRARPGGAWAASPARSHLAALGVGLVHGVLGAPALALVIAGAAATGAERALFLAGFSAGSTAAMALVTATVARAVRVPRLAALVARVPPLASAASIVLGVTWVAAA